MSGPFDPSWILSHLSPTDAAAAGNAVGAGRQVEQLRDYAARSRTIGRASKGNLPVPSELLPQHETREAWLMGHLADVLPVLGESRGMSAGMGLSRTGHPLMGAAVAGLSLLPMGSSIARSVAGHVAAGAAERAFAPEAARVLSQMRERAGVAALPRVTAVDPHAAAHMAKVYESLPKFDPAAKDAYDALNAEVAHQFQAIQDAGHTINFVDSDPYKNSKEMIADVRDNRNLNVFKTPHDSFHPYMTPEQNDKFRAVHDWLAHAGEGHSFGPIGEENAYRVHASTLSPRALPALATETRGQNSWVNFGPHAHLPVTQRPYAEQKAALWPAEFLGDYDDMAVPRPSIARPDPNVERNAIFDRMDKNAAKLTDRQKGVPGVVGDSVAMAPVAPFFSRTSQAIESAPFKKGTAEQWAAQLAKLSPAGERQWTGVDAFLKQNAGKVLTRDQVAAAHTPIQLGQKTLGKDPTQETYETAMAAANEEYKQHVDEYGQVLPGHAPAVRAIDRRLQALQRNAPEPPPTKFQQYTEPGGTNYREKLITLGGPSRQQRYNDLVEGGMPLAEAHDAVDEELPAFRSSHFDEPNILAHLRIKDRTSPDGDKVLHLEELQSDWHQKGRASGYNREVSPDEREAAARRLGRAQVDYQARYNDAMREAEDRGVDRLRVQEFLNDHEPLQAASREFVAADEAFANLHNFSGRVPDAPFKKTEDWQLLGLKHAIHDAVHGGYDRIAWTPGEQQNARYDLSKVADRVEYHPGRQMLQVWNGEDLVHTGKYDPRALPDVIGKEATDRLLQTPAISTAFDDYTDDAGWHLLKGEQLKVGGTGMRGFYDKMLPNNLRDYFKKLGVGAPEIEPVFTPKPKDVTGYRVVTKKPTGFMDDQRDVHIVDPQGVIASSRYGTRLTDEQLLQEHATDAMRHQMRKPWHNFPSFKITPELRALVKAKGQPLWAAPPIIAGGLLAGDDKH